MQIGLGVEPRPDHCDDGAAGVFEPPSKHAEEELLAAHAPTRTHREVAELVALFAVSQLCTIRSKRSGSSFSR
jgi:hypothetical protein